MDRGGAIGSEQRDGVSLALGFEKLPDRADLHEISGFALDLFHLVEEFECARIALAQRLFEIAAKTKMAAEKHVGIDVAPDIIQVRNGAGFAVEIGNRGNGNVRANFRGAFFASSGDGLGCGFFGSGGVAEGVLCKTESRRPGSLNSFMRRKPVMASFA